MVSLKEKTTSERIIESTEKVIQQHLEFKNSVFVGGALFLAKVRLIQ